MSPELAAVIERLKKEEDERPSRLAALSVKMPEPRTILYQAAVAEKIQQAEDRNASKAEIKKRVGHFVEINRSRRVKNLLEKSPGLLCHYCEIILTVENYTIDHIKPLSRGGQNIKSNRVPCCQQCNTDKGNQLHWSKGCNKNGAMRHHG